jgi:hypothetical protein
MTAGAKMEGTAAWEFFPRGDSDLSPPTNHDATTSAKHLPEICLEVVSTTTRDIFIRYRQLPVGNAIMI